MNNYILIYKSADLRIIVSALQIIQFRFGIVIITTISERVDISNVRFYFGNISAVGIGYCKLLAPRIIGISCNDSTRIIGNRDYITLKVLIEIICSTVISNSANGSVEIVQGNKSIAAPDFLYDIRSVKNVFMLNSVYRFGYSYSVIVVFIGI